MIAKIVDEPKARTRRKTFNYIREGVTLRHISKYAVSETKRGDERAFEVAYEVPIERIHGKEAYEFVFTNSGGFMISNFPSSEFRKGKDRNYESVDFEKLQNFEFEIESNEVRRLVEEIMKFYTPMITEINEFKAKIGMDHILTSERLSDYLKDLRYGLTSNLCNWPEEARVKSLEQTSKLLHQLWTLKIFHEALGVIKVERNWLTEQGSKYPASIFVDNRGNDWTCWFEPQRIKEAPPNYEGPLTSFFEGRVVWKRPDMIISEGKYNSLVDAPKFDILIECKSLPFDNWWNDGKIIKEQFLPYKILFNPEIFILVSLKSIPNWAKSRLKREDLRVIEEFYPGGEGILEFRKLVGR
jgi:hypothetical protein